MPAKKPHTGRVTGTGTAGWSDAEGPMVRIHARVTGTQDTDRPLILSMTPDEARELAARLVDKAETIELANGPKWAPAPEGEKSQHGA